MHYHAAKAFIIDQLRRGLPPQLTYHGLHHTLDVLQVVQELGPLEQTSPYDQLLLQTAALFHDTGFLITYQNHEMASCDLSRQYLPRFDYSPEEINQVCSLIMATRIPQSPNSFLAAILCDADLDYLGREDFFSTAESLYQELLHYRFILNTNQWNNLQISFLEQHTYFTPTNRRRRTAGKITHLKALRKLMLQKKTEE